MNNIDRLNEVIEYIEKNMTEDLEYKNLAKIACVDEYTLRRIFYFLTNISLSEYIRKRKLTRAGIEIQNSNMKVIDIAIKYGYESPIAFTRAFRKMHGIKPSELKKKNIYLKSFPIIKFDNTSILDEEINYKIHKSDKINLFGKCIETKIENIKIDAPIFWNDFKKDKNYNYISKDIIYGIIKYDEKFPNPEKAHYYIATQREIAEWEKFSIPKSEWAVFELKSMEGEFISNFSKKIYRDWIPYSGYNIKNIPEIEVYYKDHTEWWLPVSKKSDFS